MKVRKLKLFAGGDFNHRGGRLYVAAWSQKDAVLLLNLAWCKLRNVVYRGGFDRPSMGYFKTHYSSYWGAAMDGVTPERGVWWSKEDGRGFAGKPERITLDEKG